MELLPHTNIDAIPDLTDRQRENVKTWARLQSLLNEGKFGEEMDAFFHPDFTYSNPSRPDLGTYASWKTSPMEMRRRFPPAHYHLIDATAKGDDEIWVLCEQVGKHTGGNYMGKAPTGNEFAVQWFSIVSFRDGKIVKIFSIADVLSQLIQIGVIAPNFLPVDPYK